jgi:hypothetical protein
MTFLELGPRWMPVRYQPCYNAGVMDRGDFAGMDKPELLMAIEEVFPRLSLPETASRDDLINYLRGLRPTDFDDDAGHGLGVGVRKRGPRTPSGVLYAKAEPEREL